MRFFIAAHITAFVAFGIWLGVDLLCDFAPHERCSEPLNKIEIYGVIAAMIWCVAFVHVAEK